MPDIDKLKEVGASRAASAIIGRLDRRLRDPAGSLIRFWGYAFFFLVLYLLLVDAFQKPEHPKVAIWLLVYFFYQLSLELIRAKGTRFYDITWFRATRIILNLFWMSSLMSISSNARSILVFSFTIPIFAAIVYLSKNPWGRIFVLLLVVTGLYLGGVRFSDQPLEWRQYIWMCLALVIIYYAFNWFFQRAITTSSNRLAEVVGTLPRTLELQQLISEVMQVATNMTYAQYGLLIVINPRNKRYVTHAIKGFSLRDGYSIENVAEKCSVLQSGEPFDCPDLSKAFNDKSLYHKFFNEQPLSLLAEPLFSADGQVLGVLNVAHDNANQFDRFSQDFLREFSFHISSAIENCFIHRELKLREAQSREVGEKFVSAGSEDEAVHILIAEVRQQIPHTEKLTLHQFLPKDGCLLPIYSGSPETTPKLFIWSSPKPRETKPDFRLGYGIAGHALELRDTILVHDVDHHPWYVQMDSAQNIKSLLVAPLFDPEDNELYGTLSLESAKLSAFNLEDESTLTYLTIQASRAIAKVKDFQGWREQGGTLRRILEEIRSFDITGTESALCEQIADAAARLLGFEIARIRLLTKDDMLITVAVTGVSEKTKIKLIGTDLPYAELKPFLNQIFKAESSYLIKHGAPGWKQFVDKYFHKPRQIAHKKSGWDVYDALITPLLDPSGEVFGILTLDVPITGSEPNKQILELIGVFANAASWVIELSRFQRRLTDQQFRAKSFIDTISQELAKCRDLATICEVVVQVGAKLLSAEGCSLYLVRGNEIELTRSNYLANTDYISRRKPISARPKSGLTAWVASTGEAIYFNNEKYKAHKAWAEETDHLQFLPSKRCQSLMLAPIKDKGGKVIGVVSLENKTTLTSPKDFDGEDRDRLISLANEFARALEVIGLYDDIREWERTGLADDLHDLINWYHSGVVMWIEALEVWFQQEDFEKVKELMPELRRHALTTVLELKELHSNLLKNSFEAENLKQALQETMLAWTKRFPPKYEENMQINLECPENLEIPAGLKNTIVRIASLAFSNAIQHSGIIENPDIKVLVIVKQKNNEITLGIIDNGRGIDFEETPEGFGLGRMRQLADKINTWGDVRSNFQIKTEINHGTKVLLYLEARNQNSLI